jgi:hypothetical protein
MFLRGKEMVRVQSTGAFLRRARSIACWKLRPSTSITVVLDPHLSAMASSAATKVVNPWTRRIMSENASSFLKSPATVRVIACPFSFVLPLLKIPLLKI